MKRIECVKGEIIGNHGLIYLREVSPYVCKGGSKFRMGLFKCPCGKNFKAIISQVRCGQYKSCGCKKHDNSGGVVIHGLIGNRLYKKWKGIKRRCYNKNEDMYCHYGGRGISLFEAWISDPKSFVDYCMTLDGWDNPNLTIDRIDCDGDYEPGNIRFVTHTIQARNIRMRKSNKSGYTGVCKTKKNYVSTIGINYATLNLGTYPTAREAAIARDRYIIKNELEGFKIQVLDDARQA